MDQKTIQIIKPIRGFLAQLRKHYSPSLILLFGSRARGDHLKESDFDLLVVSEKFSGTNWLRRHEEAYGYWTANYSLDLLCYSPDEFAKKKKHLGIVQKAVKEGIAL